MYELYHIVHICPHPFCSNLWCKVRLQVCIVTYVHLVTMGLVHSVVQSILSDTSITLANTTMWPCTGLNAEILNAMEINVPPGIPTLGLAGVELNSFNMSMTATSCDGGNCTTTALGYFPTKNTQLGLGHNKVSWDVGASLYDGIALLNGFILPMFLEGKSVDLTLKSDDVSLWIRFVVLPSPTFKNLKLENTLSCRMLGMTPAKDIDDKFCPKKENAKGRRLDGSQGYSIHCTPKSAVLAPSVADIVV